LYWEPTYIGEMQMTRYVAVSVEQTPDGEFLAGECDEVRSALLAIRKARSLAEREAPSPLNVEAT
jgi:hypothetical protein